MQLTKPNTRIPLIHIGMLILNYNANSVVNEKKIYKHFSVLTLEPFNERDAWRRSTWNGCAICIEPKYFSRRFSAHRFVNNENITKPNGRIRLIKVFIDFFHSRSTCFPKFKLKKIKIKNFNQKQFSCTSYLLAILENNKRVFFLIPSPEVRRLLCTFRAQPPPTSSCPPQRWSTRPRTIVLGAKIKNKIVTSNAVYERFGITTNRTTTNIHAVEQLRSLNCTRSVRNTDILDVTHLKQRHSFQVLCPFYCEWCSKQRQPGRPRSSVAFGLKTTSHFQLKYLKRQWVMSLKCGNTHFW